MSAQSAITLEGFITRAAILWNKGMDTKAIARELLAPEHEIYNRIDLIKDRAKRLAR